MMTKTFMAGCKYTSGKAAYSNDRSDSSKIVLEGEALHSMKHSLCSYDGPVFVSTTVGAVTVVLEVGTTGTGVGVVVTGTACRE